MNNWHNEGNTPKHKVSYIMGRTLKPIKVGLVLCLYTAVSTKVVQKKRKSVRDNAEIHFVSFNTRKHVFIAPPSIALKTRELDDAPVNNHNPSCLSVLSRTLSCFSVGQPFSKQLYMAGYLFF